MKKRIRSKRVCLIRGGLSAGFFAKHQNLWENICLRDECYKKTLKMLYGSRIRRNNHKDLTGKMFKRSIRIGPCWKRNR